MYININIQRRKTNEKSKCLSVVLSALIIISASIPVFAADKSKGMLINDLDKKYNLKIATSIPKGVTPIKFNTVEEADQFLNNLKNSPTVVNIPCLETNKYLDMVKNGLKTTPTNDLMMAAAATTSAADKINQITEGPAMWMNIDMSYHYAYSTYLGTNNFTSVDKISSYLSGITIGYAWTQQNFWSNLTDYNTTANVGVSGTEEYYIFVNTTLTRFWTQTKTYTTSFTNP